MAKLLFISSGHDTDQLLVSKLQISCRQENNGGFGLLEPNKVNVELHHRILLNVNACI
jgi:hypothetical protein